MTDPDYPATEWITEVIGSELGRIVHDVISHPDEAPTLTELYYINPSTDDERIDKQVEVLVDLGVLRYVGDEPFVGFTEEGKQFVVDSRMYRGSAVMKNVYQRIEMTEEFENSFFKERPESYLEDVVQPDFEEREWVRNSDSYEAGFDAISVTTRLTVTERDDQTGVSVLFERNPSPEATDEWEEVLSTDYAYTEGEETALRGEREPFEEVSEGAEYLSSQSPPESYVIEVDVFAENSLSPSVSVRVVNEDRDLQPTASAYVEPSLNY